VFFSGVNYTRLQFNTGLRYLSPILPFLFVPAALVLMRLPRIAAFAVGVLAIAEGWSLAMYRDVERGPLGVLDPVLQVFIGGFQLPALTTLARVSGPFEFYMPFGPNPIPLFLLAAALIWGVWRVPATRVGR
jgi:hypothetical protein